MPSTIRCFASGFPKRCRSEQCGRAADSWRSSRFSLTRSRGRRVAESNLGGNHQAGITLSATLRRVACLLAIPRREQRGHRPSEVLEHGFVRQRNREPGSALPVTLQALTETSFDLARHLRRAVRWLMLRNHLAEQGERRGEELASATRSRRARRSAFFVVAASPTRRLPRGDSHRGALRGAASAPRCRTLTRPF
jgi:hypothetical protein